MIGPLTNHLWQSTAFGLAIAVLTFFFRKCGAHVRYGLWFSASIKFFLPFVFLIALGRQLEWAPAVREAASPTVSATMVRISEPFFEAKPAVLPAPPANRRTIGWIAIVLPAIWACGCLTIALIRVRLWRRIRIIVRASTPLTLPGIETPPGLQIRSTEGLLEPGVVGMWRPTLLLPAGLERDLTLSQLRAVIWHEVSHVRRRDNITAGVHMLVEVLFWFHPLVWWIGSRLVDERERACDEEVLRLLGEPEAYAEGILIVCKRYVESPLSCVSGVSGSNIRKRIEGILNNHIGTRLTFGRIAVLLLAAVFAFGTPIVVGSMSVVLPYPFAQAPPAAPSAEALSAQPPATPAIVPSSQATTPQVDKPVPFNYRVDFVRVTEDTVLTQITMQLQNKDLAFQESDGIHRALAHVLIKITQFNGRVAPGGVAEDSVSVAIPDALFKQSLEGVRIYQKVMPLKPGLYKMDIVIKDQNSGNTGFLNQRLSVPTYPDQRLQLSSLIMAQKVEPLPPTEAGTAPFTIGGQRVWPNVTGEFLRDRDKDVDLYFQVYNLKLDEATRKPSATVEILITKNGEEVKKIVEQASELANAAAQMTIVQTLPTMDFEPGQYGVQVRVTDNLTKDVIVSRETFTVH